jgi:dipeptidase E
VLRLRADRCRVRRGVEVLGAGDRRQLEVPGCEVSTLDLATVEVDEVDEVLRGLDGVFLTGGNSFLLLLHALRSGFAERVVPLVERGELLYVGTSAGAVVAGPDVGPVVSSDGRRAVPELESSRALGLVDFIVLPHDQEPEFQARNDEIVSTHPSVPFIRLTDDRAVLARGSEADVVESQLLA